MKEKGFTLIEVLVALVILAMVLVAFLKLQGQAIESQRRASILLEGVYSLDAWLKGEAQGLPVKQRLSSLKEWPIKVHRYSLTLGDQEIVFYRYEPK